MPLPNAATLNRKIFAWSAIVAASLSPTFFAKVVKRSIVSPSFFTDSVSRCCLCLFFFRYERSTEIHLRFIAEVCFEAFAVTLSLAFNATERGAKSVVIGDCGTVFISNVL